MRHARRPAAPPTRSRAIAALAALLLTSGLGVTAAYAVPEGISLDEVAELQSGASEGAEAGTQVPGEVPTVELPTVELPGIEIPGADGVPTEDAAEVETPADELPTPQLLNPQARSLDASTFADVGISPMSVPSVPANGSVITVKIRSTRSATDQTAVSVLPGVTLRLFDGGTAGPNANPTTMVIPPIAPATENASCISDAAGDCSFVVPQTQAASITCPANYPYLRNSNTRCYQVQNGGGNNWVTPTQTAAGVNYNKQFWIVAGVGANATPVGWYSNDSLTTGSYNSPGTAPYPGRTGQLVAGSTLSYTAAFSVANPEIVPRCAADAATNPLKVALILDLSSSVALTTNGVTNLKAAASGFVNTLADTAPTAQVGIFTFATRGPAATTGANNGTPAASSNGSRLLAAGTGRTALLNGISSLSITTNPTVYTNWDQGTYQVAQAGGASKVYDLAIVVTDGLPTVYGTQSPNTDTEVNDVVESIYSANSLKAKGTRVLALGVGTGTTSAGPNLAAISGPTKYVAGGDPLKADYFQTSWETLRPVLAQLAAGATCQAVVEVTKTAQAFGGSPALAGGWNFSLAATAESGTAGLVPNTNQLTSTATGSEGVASWVVKYSKADGTGSVTLTELPSQAQTNASWALQGVTCTVNDSPRNVQVINNGVTLTGIKVGDDVQCTFSNAQTLTSTMTVEKRAYTPTSPAVADGYRTGVTAFPTTGQRASGSSIVSGTTITFWYAVKNTGQSVLTNVAVTDNRKTTSNSQVCTVGTLAVGATAYCTWTSPVVKNP